MEGFGAIAFVPQRNNVVQGSSNGNPFVAEKGQSVSSQQQPFLTLISNMLSGQGFKEEIAANGEMTPISEEAAFLSEESIVTELSKLLESLEQPTEGQLGDVSKLLEQLLGMLSEEVSLNTERLNEGMLESLEQVNIAALQAQVQTIFPILEKGPGIQSLSYAETTKIVQVLFNLYEKVAGNSNHKGIEILHKLEHALGKLAELSLTNNQSNQSNEGKWTNANHEKQWNNILEQVKALISTSKANNSTTNGIQSATNQNGNHPIQQIVANALGNVMLDADKAVMKETQYGSVEAAPISKLEQYTIYLQRQSGTENTGKQLMDQFEQIVKSSRFLQKNGTMELTLKLRPAHLGDMVVKISQLNGEMAVKITVASSTVKELLESNMNQLRNMFSPNQVIIEKQQDPFSQSLPTYLDQQKQNEEERQQDSPYKEEDAGTKGEVEKEEEQSFKDVLFQMQV